MTTLVLVVDANAAFATMLQQALHDQGGYRVTTAGTAAEAIEQAAQTAFDLAIVDLDLPDVPGADAIRGLRATRPDLAIVAIPVDADPGDPALRALDLQGFLTKPFFLPTLGQVVAEALAQPVGGVARVRPERPSEPEPAAPAPTPAVEAVAPAWLEDRALASRRLAGLVRHSPAEAALVVRGAQVAAVAGEFPAEEIDQLAGIVQANWAGGRAGSRGALMRFVKLPSLGAERLLYASLVAPGLVLALVYRPDLAIGVVRKHAREVAQAALAEAPAEAAEMTAPAEPAVVAPAKPVRAPVTRPLEVGTQTAPPPPAWVSSPAPEPPAGLSVTLPPEIVVDVGLSLPGETSASGLARTPHALYNLVYSIVWAPKFPKTRLIGNITGLLDQWIRHIALSYDWRVDRVEVRPECVMVVVNSSPEIAPERLVNTLKRTTSDKAFAEFPSLAADHPGGDFWAPGYLLQAGSQPLTPQQIEDFLAYTRREQGLRR